MVSFIIPAYNEEACIARTVRAIKGAARRAGAVYEIIVVDDDSSDRTAEIGAREGARVVRVKNRHIAATRNAGARVARGDRFVFVDGDTEVSDGAVEASLRVLDEGAIGGGCLVRFDEPLPLYARLLQPLALLAIRSACFAAGCFLFCTRDAFGAAGGFDERMYGGEEIAMSLALKRQGRFVVVDQWVVTSGRKLRAYSGSEILAVLAALASRGRRSVESREGLELWYGPRRNDPADDRRASNG